MSIPIKFMTAAIKKSAIRRHYPHGLTGFRRDYPSVIEDYYLVGLVSMSGGELQEMLDRIGNAGIDLPACCCVADAHLGPLDPHPHFDFIKAPDVLLPTWEVRLVNDDASVLAEDGAALLTWLMGNDRYFDIPDEVLVTNCNALLIRVLKASDTNAALVENIVAILKNNPIGGGLYHRAETLETGANVPYSFCWASGMGSWCQTHTYKKHFGKDIPDWVNRRNPHQILALCNLAIRLNQALPEIDLAARHAT